MILPLLILLNASLNSAHTIHLNTPINTQDHPTQGTSAMSGDCRHHLLHFTSANLHKAQNVLTNMDIKWDYIPENTLNAYMCASELAQFPRELLKWNGHLHPQHKVHDHHRRLSKVEVQEDKPIELVVHTAPVDMTGLWTRSPKISSLLEEIAVVRSDKYLVKVRPSNLHTVLDILAEQGEVKKVERRQSFSPQNSKATTLLQSAELGPHPIWDRGITGKGILVHVGDTGLDYDSCFFDDTRHNVSFFPDQNSKHRKIHCYIEASDDYGGYDHTDPNNAHGTHVSGSVAGQSEGTNQQYNGMAYDARIIFTDLSAYGQDIFLPADFDLYFRPPWEMGAFVSSNSWGSNDVTKDYVDTDREADIFQYYTQDFLVVVAAGNTGSSGLLSPGSAKNTLSIGSTYNSAGTTRTVIPGFSARGPTWDRRVKPDVVLPGSSITSARSDGRLNSRNQCAMAAKSGTSMSTPLGAGTAVLVSEYFERGWYPSGSQNNRDKMHPSAALIKAMIIQGTVSCGGQLPGSKQGFGLVRIDQSLWFSNTTGFNLWVENNATVKHHGEWSKCFKVRRGAILKVTMVFMDAIADPTSSRSMVNNLDLTLLTSADILKGNENIKNDWDDNNVVEQIITTTTFDEFRLHVYGHNVPVSFANGQPFAIVITGQGVSEQNDCPRECAKCDQGTCTDGVCQCSNDFHHVTCSKCDPDALCSGHGECLCSDAASCQRQRRCRCDLHFVQDDCSQCETGWYGGSCDSDCNCHGHGVCDKATGICNCDNSDSKGHFGSKMCDICDRNWADADCKTRSHWCENFNNVTVQDQGGVLQVTGENVYTTNMKCGWIIRSRQREPITINFKWVNTEADYDPIWVFYTDNPDYHNPKAYLTGKAYNKRYTSTTGVMFVVFESDITNVATGFYATYTVGGVTGKEHTSSLNDTEIDYQNELETKDTTDTKARTASKLGIAIGTIVGVVLVSTVGGLLLATRRYCTQRPAAMQHIVEDEGGD